MPPHPGLVRARGASLRIVGVGRALPPHRYPQARITAELEEIWRDRPALMARIGDLHANARVETRHMALPLEAYKELTSFADFNDAWIEAAVDLGEGALRDALDRAGLGPDDLDALFVATVTGVASPSLDAKLINRMGLRPDIVRVPIFGLGCVAGAATVARAADHVRAYPERVAAALTVEVCSLTWQRDDVSIANAISTGLFADGAGCALVAGERRSGGTGPRIVDTRSTFYPDTEDLMGWNVSERGFRIVLSPDVPVLARERIGLDVDAFLADHGLAREDIAAWICHPGGPKVLEGLRDGLGLSDDDVALAWEALRTTGNLSSASVLLVLRATLEEGRPGPGEHAVLLAMGPGFCSELVLLRG